VPQGLRALDLLDEKADPRGFNRCRLVNARADWYESVGGRRTPS